jgi:hypothetical protein
VKTFRTGCLRKHRAKTLRDREKAMLPAMQIFVEATKNIRKLAETHQEVASVARKYDMKRIELLRNRDTFRTKIRMANTKDEEAAALRELQQNCESYGKNEGKLMRIRFDQETIQRDITRWTNILEGRDANDNRVSESREFIQRCPAEGCRGYLSTAYKCGTCAKFCCSDCLSVKGDTRDAAHTCDEEAKASAAMIRRETKPCPKCGVRIYKIDGCDQMFCTQEACHTAFSWNTGQLITGVIHNPHYYEYLRHRNGGALPREPGDIPCGGLPPIWTFTREITSIPLALLSVDSKNRILNIHRCLTDIAEVRLAEFPARRPANVNKDINIQYLMNEISEDDWQRMLEQRETKFERKREIGQILTTFAHVGAEFMRSLATNVEGEAKMRYISRIWQETLSTQMEDLRLYTNKSLVYLGKRMCCAIPQIDPTWYYLGPRKEGLPISSGPVIAPPAPAPPAAPRAVPRAAPPTNRFNDGDFADDDNVLVE